MSRGRSDRAVAEQVERDDAVAARGERLRQRHVHLLREQQAVDEDGRPLALAVDRVGEPAAVVTERGHEGRQDSERAGGPAPPANLGAQRASEALVSRFPAEWPILPRMEASAFQRPVAAQRRRLPRLQRSDASLAARVRGGDERAFEELYDRHAAPLLAFCRHLLGSREESEDALQHTFLSAHRALERDGAPEHVKAWLYTIARNRCLSVLRARRDEVALDEDGGRAGVVSTRGLAAEVEERADLRALVGDLGRLPDEQRAALVLFELGDHSQDDIAEILGVRREKVKALVFQAREALIGWRAARETPCADVREQLVDPARQRAAPRPAAPPRRAVQPAAASSTSRCAASAPASPWCCPSCPPRG